MTHITTRLSKAVELGATRRDVDEVEVVRTDGGRESRNSRWSQSLLEFDVGYPISRRDHARLTEVLHCFKATRGGLHSFDFRDWLDFQALDEEFATGDGATTVFGLTKTYSFGTASHVRRVQRPVSPITLKKNGVATAIGFTVDYELGTVTFAAAPLGGGTPDVWSWSGEFDVPVRFNGPLESSAPTIQLEKTGSIPLIEVRLKAGDFE